MHSHPTAAAANDDGPGLQAKLFTYVMPAFFTMLMLSYPAGLSLYIFTNNILSIAQTYGLKRYIRRKEALA